jgi:hypothetical protein
MADTTANRGYPYPELSDSYSPSSGIQALAEGVDVDVDAIEARVTALEDSVARDQILYENTSTTSSGAVGTSESVVITVPSQTYLANRLYRLQVTGALTMSAGTAYGACKIRKTNAAGAIVLEWPRTGAPGHTNAFDVPLKDRYFKVGGSNVTTALVFTLTSSAAATVTHSAAATYPRGVHIYAAGPQANQPTAVTLS